MNMKDKIIIDFYDMTIENELLGTIRFNSINDLESFLLGFICKTKYSYAYFDYYNKQLKCEDSEKEEC